MNMFDLIRQSPGGGTYWMEQVIAERELGYWMHQVIESLIYCNIPLYLSMNGLTGLTLESARICEVPNNGVRP